MTKIIIFGETRWRRAPSWIFEK